MKIPKWIKKILSDPIIHYPEVENIMEENVIEEIVIKESPECNCKESGQEDYEQCEHIRYIKHLNEYCNKYNILIEQEFNVSVGGETLYTIVDDIEGVKINAVEWIHASKEFVKIACLTCKTCLGWYIVTFRTKDKITGTPDEYFDNIFKNFRDTKAEEINRKKEARKICK